MLSLGTQFDAEWTVDSDFGELSEDSAPAFAAQINAGYVPFEIGGFAIGPLLRGSVGPDKNAWTGAAGVRLSYGIDVGSGRDCAALFSAIQLGYRFGHDERRNAPYVGLELAYGSGINLYIGPVVGVTIDPSAAGRGAPFTDGATLYAGIRLGR